MEACNLDYLIQKVLLEEGPLTQTRFKLTRGKARKLLLAAQTEFVHKTKCLTDRIIVTYKPWQKYLKLDDVDFVRSANNYISDTVLGSKLSIVTEEDMESEYKIVTKGTMQYEAVEGAHGTPDKLIYIKDMDSYRINPTPVLPGRIELVVSKHTPSSTNDLVIPPHYATGLIHYVKSVLYEGNPHLFRAWSSSLVDWEGFLSNSVAELSSVFIIQSRDIL